MTPGPSQPPIPPMYFINWCTWKVIAALHYNNHDGVIYSHHFMLVFHQSNILAPSGVYFSSLSMQCMLKAGTLRVGVKTLYTINVLFAKSGVVNQVGSGATLGRPHLVEGCISNFIPR